MKLRALGIYMVLGLAIWMLLLWNLALLQTTDRAAETDEPPGSSTAPVEPPLTGWEAFVTNVDENASNIGKITVTPVLAYLSLLGAVLGIYVLYRLIPLFVRPPELVIEPFRNSSGEEALAGVVGGLSRLTRQKLMSQMEILQLAREATAEAKANRETRANALRETSAQAKFERKTSANALNFNYPQETPDQSLNELVSPLKELAPDQFKSLLVFIGAAFPRRGIRVRTDLQRRNNLPGGLGISFELEDMSNRQEPDLGTIWEPTAEVTAAGDPQPPTTTTTPAGQPLPNRKGHRRVAKVDAKKTEPSAAETEAKALYTLGALYEGDGDLEQAKSRYEDAFKKQPTSVENYAALRRVLEKEHALVERYNDLLDSAVRWLALQIDRRGWLAKKISPGPDRERYLGEVYNNFGVLYQSSGPPYGSFFYRLAVADFERAIEHRGDWHVPYMQLAVTYSFMGRDGEPHRRDVFQRKALREYYRALRRVDQEAEPKVADAVKTGRAIVQLLTRDAGLRAKAEREIQRIEESNDITTKLLCTKEEDVSLLYNLACWYSIAYGQELKIADAKEICLRHLTYCLAADRKRKKVWDWAEIDPDLKPIRNSISGGLTSLKDELSTLPEVEDKKYSEALRDIPRKIQWKKEATEGPSHSGG